MQVIDGSGQVVAASSDRAGVAPLTTVRPGDGQIREIKASQLSLLDDDDPYLLVVAGVQHAAR